MIQGPAIISSPGATMRAGPERARGLDHVDAARVPAESLQDGEIAADAARGVAIGQQV
jgi:hypothetical protein